MTHGDRPATSDPSGGVDSGPSGIELAQTGPWCRVCGTRHVIGPCHREYLATGPERHGWRALVEGRDAPDVYGVLVAPAGHLWRARILTYPNVIWMVPGGGASMKFLGTTAALAEAAAVLYLTEHCKATGVKISRRLPDLDPGPLDSEEAPASRQDSEKQAARRRLRHLPLRWGTDGPNEDGYSEDLSEGGLFLISGKIQPEGTRLVLSLRLGEATVALVGVVTWVRAMASQGRRVGMGVRLDAPPRAYLEFVRSLP
jgi:hypothetical protein